MPVLKAPICISAYPLSEVRALRICARSIYCVVCARSINCIVKSELYGSNPQHVANSEPHSGAAPEAAASSALPVRIPEVILRHLPIPACSLSSLWEVRIFEPVP